MCFSRKKNHDRQGDNKFYFFENINGNPMSNVKNWDKFWKSSGNSSDGHVKILVEFIKGGQQQQIVILNMFVQFLLSAKKTIIFTDIENILSTRINSLHPYKNNVIYYWAFPKKKIYNFFLEMQILLNENT